MNVGVSSRGVTGGDPPNVTFEIFRRVENALGTAAAEIFDSFLEHKDSDEHEHNVVKRRSDDIFRAKEEATGGTDPTHMFTFPPVLCVYVPAHSAHCLYLHAGAVENERDYENAE